MRHCTCTLITPLFVQIISQYLLSCCQSLARGSFRKISKGGKALRKTFGGGGGGGGEHAYSDFEGLKFPRGAQSFHGGGGLPSHDLLPPSPSLPRPSLTHQRPQEEKQKQFSDISEWYQKGTQKKAAIKFRKGACENCGSMTHKKKDCLEVCIAAKM